MSDGVLAGRKKGGKDQDQPRPAMDAGKTGGMVVRVPEMAVFIAGAARFSELALDAGGTIHAFWEPLAQKGGSTMPFSLMKTAANRRFPDWPEEWMRKIPRLSWGALPVIIPPPKPCRFLNPADRFKQTDRHPEIHTGRHD